MRINKLSKIYTLDIETDKDGLVLDIGFYDGEQIKYFPNWEKFEIELDGIESSALIYAHNGGGFDYVNFLHSLFIRGIKFEAMLKQSKIFAFWLCDKPNIKFVDSFNILPASLDKITKSFSELEKLEIDNSHYADMRKFKISNTNQYYDYLDRDLISLYQAVLKMQNLVNEIAYLGNLPMSIGGISMRLFSRSFLGGRLIVPSKAEKEFTFNSYVGGRCEFLGFAKESEHGWLHGVNGYDFNSHYPSQMLGKEFPIRRGCFTKDFVRDKDGTIRNGIYNAEFEQISGRIPLLQTIDNQYDFNGFGCYTHYELNEIEANGGSVKCLGGYHYEYTANIFDAFVKFFFERRLESQKIGDDARNTFYKLVLNNLYGKFGQRDEVESLAVYNRLEVDRLLQKGIYLNEFYRLDDDNAFYEIKQEKICYTSFPAIASQITAAARIKLNQTLEICKNPIYCDTDSIHCLDQLPSKMIGENLGQLKIEFYNAKARYGGKKSYQIENEKTRQKGIPQNKANSEMFENLFKKGSVKVDYNRPLMLKSSIKRLDVSPSKFIQFTRTITRDKSLAEKLGINNFEKNK